jgi:hypothetical protein
MKNFLLFLPFFLLSIIFQLTIQSCTKPKYAVPTCDNNCITFNLVFWDSTLNQPFANQKIAISETHASGLGNSYTKLLEINTNSNGQLYLDVSFDDIKHGTNLSAGQLSFFLCGKSKYSSGFSEGNKISLFVKNTDIGKTISRTFKFFVKP